MDWKTFIASIVSSLAWPGVLAFILIKNKGTILKLIQTLKTLKAGDFEFDFTKEVKELKEVEQSQFGNLDQDIFNQNIPTKYMITEFWMQLESALNLCANNNGINLKSNMQETINELNKLKIINNKDAYIITELRKLRNEAVHSIGFNPDKSSVLEYRYLVNNLLGKLK